MRRGLYRFASALGWANAIARGPGALLARFLRVAVLKLVSGLLRAVLPGRRR